MLFSFNNRGCFILYLDTFSFSFEKTIFSFDPCTIEANFKGIKVLNVKSPFLK